MKQITKEEAASASERNMEIFIDLNMVNAENVYLWCKHRMRKEAKDWFLIGFNACTIIFDIIIIIAALIKKT